MDYKLMLAKMILIVAAAAVTVVIGGCLRQMYLDVMKDREAWTQRAKERIEALIIFIIIVTVLVAFFWAIQTVKDSQ